MPVPARRGEKFRVDAQVVNCVISACIHNRRPDEAIAALKEARTWPNCDGPDGAAYSTLVQGLLRHERLREATEAAMEALGMFTANGEVLKQKQTGGAAAKKRQASGPRSIDADCLTALLKALNAAGPLARSELAEPLELRMKEVGLGGQAPAPRNQSSGDWRSGAGGRRQ